MCTGLEAVVLSPQITKYFVNCIFAFFLFLFFGGTAASDDISITYRGISCDMVTTSFFGFVVADVVTTPSNTTDLFAIAIAIAIAAAGFSD